VRARSEAMKRSAPKPLLTIFIPFHFVQFFNLYYLKRKYGERLRQWRDEGNQPFMMPIALKAATFLAMPASSQLATTSSGFL